MKIKGQNISQPKSEIVVIPREDGNIIFEAKAVLDFTKFDELCPEPKVPVRHYPDGREEEDSNDSGFKRKETDWAKRKSAWMILESLSATKDLTWDTVKEDDPSSWENYRDELAQCFTQGEIGAILDAVYKANSIDNSRLEEAKANFLAMQQQA